MFVAIGSWKLKEIKIKHNLKLGKRISRSTWKLCGCGRTEEQMRRGCGLRMRSGTAAERMRTAGAKRLQIECGQRTLDFYFPADAEGEV